MLKMSENALESKLQLDMTNWKCTGGEFDVEVALNGGCRTLVFLHGSSSARLLTSQTDAQTCVSRTQIQKNILLYFLSAA